MSKFQEQMAAIEELRQAIGDIATDAALKAVEDAHFAEVKEAQAKAWDKTRKALDAVVTKIHNTADLPGLRIVLTDFNVVNGPKMVVSTTATVEDNGKSITQYLFGAPIRKARKAGKGLAGGPVKVIMPNRKLSGNVYGSTQALCLALGYDERGKYGWSNVLRSHGFNRGTYYEYVKFLEAEAAKTAK